MLRNRSRLPALLCCLALLMGLCSGALAEIETDYRHPTFRGIAYGSRWNYSLTLGWAARPLWLYSGGEKLLFRQRVGPGDPEDIILLTLWIREPQEDLQLCMDPKFLTVLERNGIELLRVKNGPDETATASTTYDVIHLLQLVESTGSLPDSGDFTELWLGGPDGPRLVPAEGADVTFEPGSEFPW